MKLQKCGHETGHDSVHYEGKDNEDIGGQLWVVVGQELVVESPFDGLGEVVKQENGGSVSDEQDVNEQQ